MRKIIHCPTKDLYNKVLEKLERENSELRWNSDDKPTKKPIPWEKEKEDMCLVIDHTSWRHDECIMYGNYFSLREAYPNVEIEEAEDYLLSSLENIVHLIMGECMTDNPLETSVASGKTSPVNDFDFYVDKNGGLLNKLKTKLKTNMNLIKNLFKKEETKALEYFGLGDKDGLNQEGRAEFVDFLFTKLEDEKSDFIKKIVQEYKNKKSNY